MRTFILLLLIVAAAVSGCGRSRNPGAAHDHSSGHAHGPESDHKHEVKTAQITVWTDRFEIFAEHTPPVAGKSTEFITHVSDLRDGTARRSGPVKFVLRQGATRFEHPQDRPNRPGIYIPAITFPSAGEWQASVIIPAETNVMVELGPIKVFPTEDAAAHAELPEAPEGVSFLKEQQWRIQAKTEPVARRTLVARVGLHATVVSAPGGKAIVYAPVAGRLASEEMARLGAEVRAGEILAWLEPMFNEFTTKLVEAEAEALRARVTVDQAKTALERTRGLFDQQAKSQREVQEAELAYRSAEASFEAARTIQQLYGATGATFKDGSLRIAIKAPIDGVVDSIAPDLGGRVEPELALFTIINPVALLVTARVPETRLTQIKPELGTVLQVVSEGESSTVSNGLEFLALGRELDPATRTVPLTFSYKNGDRKITLGAAGTLFVATGKSAEAIAVPSRAIVEEEGIPIVFVQLSGETFEKRDVRPGLRDGDWTEIQVGVREGERVVTDGAYALLLSTKSGTIPAHGHAH